jgi:hypothetical protein
MRHFWESDWIAQAHKENVRKRSIHISKHGWKIYHLKCMRTYGIQTQGFGMKPGMHFIITLMKS